MRFASRSVAVSLSLSAVLALLAFVPPHAAPVTSLPAAPGEVVIDEVAASGSRAPSDGFFELRNIAEHPVDLSGFLVFRCDGQGLRANTTDTDADLRGVVLAPGETFTVAHRSARDIDADARFERPIDPTGFGFVLTDRRGHVIDRIAVYPNEPIATASECGAGPNLPVTLAAALDESWQRTPDGAWSRSRATPAATNATRTAAAAQRTVRVDEVTAAGPGGHGDDFTELVNAGSVPAKVGGWRLYRCTGRGVLDRHTLQFEFGADAVLAPGARFVIGGPEFVGDPDARARTSLADRLSGVLLVDAAGRRVDGVTVSSDADSACQDGDAKLAAELDHRTGESWQRTPDGGFVIAARTPGRDNAEPDSAVVAVSGASPSGVAISEIATDPQLPGEAGRRNFVELANYSDREIDVSGWTLVACGTNGFRRFDTLAIIDDTRLAPGEAWVAALRGTTATARADAVYDEPLAAAGAGAWLEDAQGRRVDSVGIYHRNEMDANNEQPSACTNGMALSTFAVDRLRSESFQRTGFTGDDASDFTPALATPGGMTPLRVTDAGAIADAASAHARGSAPTADAAVAAAPAPSPADAAESTVLSAHAGHAAAALTAWSAPGEMVAEIDAPLSRDDAYDHPYLRLTVTVSAAGATVGWSGRVVGRGAARLSVWDAATASWRTLDQRSGVVVAGDDGAAEAPVTLQGRVRASEASDGVATLLVQTLPRSSPLDDDPALADPRDYDLALSHLTDTQYYSEAYPEVYAAQVAWIAANADARRIEFATHTGDLVQNWVDPGQSEHRARREFETASTMQSVLDDAGVPNSVLPGNHDSKRGITHDLYNDYFGPRRYADRPWWGGSIGPDDNRAGYARFSAAGARFLMLTLPYAYGEDEVAWAEEVVAQHPDHNVVVSTHEHLTPKSQTSVAARSNSSRWLSRADLLWERVVAPHRNVVLVLSGHFHGIGAIVTEDAGGIVGHTVVEALADYQEFRTPTGERATGFQRLLQLDLAGSRLAVDTFSVPLGADSSHRYDYGQFVPADGHGSTPSNEQPWNIVGEGLQHRYSEADDAFTVDLALQYAKAVETDAVWTAPFASRDR